MSEPTHAVTGTDLISGEFRSPRNMYSASEASIHNDAVASKLGFKGGTVPGSIHMDQFVPLLLEIYGQAWFEHGDLSVYFTQATVDNEAVQAIAEPGSARTRLRMINEAGDLVCQGSASLGAPDAGSELATRMAVQGRAEDGRLRILGDIEVGDENRDLPVRISRAELDRARATITEDVDDYAGRGALPPSQIVHLAHMTRAVAMAKQKKAVGLFGALEVKQFRGPLLAEVDYLADTRILKLSESPRTENVWYDVAFRRADDPDAPPVGAMLYCLRFMKASSPLWPSEKA